MNVSDPLWKTRHNATLNSASVVGAKLTPHFEDQHDRFQHIIQATETSVAENITLSQNQTDSIVSAISTSGPHLFTFQTFLIVAFTLTFMTIILPLLAGNIFRAVLQSLDRYKSHWRILVFISSVSTVVLFRTLLPENLEFVYIVVFGAPQALFAILQLLGVAFISKRWIAYTAILSVSLSYDISSMVGSDTFEPGLFLGLTGILPLVYIFVLGSVDNIVVLVRTQFPSFQTVINIPAIITNNKKAWFWVIVICWVGINIGLYFAWDTILIYIAGYAVAFGLYGLG